MRQWERRTKSLCVILTNTQIKEEPHIIVWLIRRTEILCVFPSNARWVFASVLSTHGRYPVKKNYEIPGFVLTKPFWDWVHYSWPGSV